MKPALTYEEYEQEVLFYTEEFQLEMWRMASRYADALIEIGAGFWSWDFGDGHEGAACLHCGQEVCLGCEDDCPGLLARRALGVA